MLVGGAHQPIGRNWPGIRSPLGGTLLLESERSDELARRGSFGPVEVHGCQGIGCFGKASSYQGLEIGLEPVVCAKGFCERLPCRFTEFLER